MNDFVGSSSPVSSGVAEQGGLSPFSSPPCRDLLPRRSTPVACSDFHSPYLASLSRDSFALSSSPCREACPVPAHRALFLESSSALPLALCRRRPARPPVQWGPGISPPTSSAGTRPDGGRLVSPPPEQGILRPHRPAGPGCSSWGWGGGWSFWPVLPTAGIRLGRLYHSRGLCMYLTGIQTANEGT